MSGTQETNNHNRVPTPDTAIASAPAGSYTRDPKYYYDGSVVILVGVVLFKVPKSILLSHIVQELAPYAKISRSDIEQSEKGTSDSDPFVVSEVTTQQFRWFLLLLLGAPNNPEYKSRFISARNARSPTKDDFLCYLGICVITEHFGMCELDDWSYSQLELVLESATVFVNTSWDKDTIMQAATYAGRGRYPLTFQLRAFIYLALSTSAPNSPLAYQSPLSSNLDTCVALYKDPNISRTHPDIFGYVFTVILSLGHRSSVWANQLTREDRNILYAAQTYLVSLRGESGLDLSWLSRASPKNWEFVCKFCTDCIDAAWDANLAGYSNLDSIIPLEDIARLVLLPSYGQKFFNQIRSNNSNSCTGSCDTTAWYAAMQRTEMVFLGMGSKYKYFVEDA